MSESRHNEILGFLSDGTRVPAAISSEDCDKQHTRTIGPRERFRETCGVSSSGNGAVNLKRESPGRDLNYET